jgi:predicted  nucleic acid-binding Zn-ribbon protein
MKLTSHQIKKIILEELEAVLYEEDSISQKLDNLYNQKNEYSQNQLASILDSLIDDPEVKQWVDKKVSDITSQISSIESQINAQEDSYRTGAQGLYREPEEYEDPYDLGDEDDDFGSLLGQASEIESLKRKKRELEKELGKLNVNSNR